MKTVRNILQTAALCAVISSFGIATAQAQEQGISITPDNPVPPHPNALFEVIEDDKGILVPRISWTKIDGLNGDDIQIDNATSPYTTAARESAGLLVYVNSGSPPDGEGFYYYDTDGDVWRKLASQDQLESFDEPWKEIDAGGTLANGEDVPELTDKINMIAGEQPLSIRKLGNGTVQIAGVIEFESNYQGSDPASEDIFFLPVGYRPLQGVARGYAIQIAGSSSQYWPVVAKQLPAGTTWWVEIYAPALNGNKFYVNIDFATQ